MSITQEALFLHEEFMPPLFPGGMGVRPPSPIESISTLESYIQTELYPFSTLAGSAQLQVGTLTEQVKAEIRAIANPLPNGPNGADIHLHHHSVLCLPGDPKVETLVVPDLSDVLFALQEVYREVRNRIYLEVLTGRDRSNETCQFFDALDAYKPPLKKPYMFDTTHFDEHELSGVRTQAELILALHTNLFFIEKNGNMMFTTNEQSYKLFVQHEAALEDKSFTVSAKDCDAHIIYRLMYHALSLRNQFTRSAGHLAYNIQLNDHCCPIGKLALSVRNNVT